MDYFMRGENIEVFRKWAYYQVISHPDLRIEEENERTYCIFYQDKVARLVIWPIGIVEESIRREEDLLFYLHYQFQTFNYATDLFERMLMKLMEDDHLSKHQILLCCSGGMTTTYFKEKMNKYLSLNHSLYHVDAAAVDQVHEIASEYDLVLVAPQMRYSLSDVQKQAPGCTVEPIEPKIFATYDCALLYEQIEDFYEKRNEE